MTPPHIPSASMTGPLTDPAAITAGVQVHSVTGSDFPLFRAAAAAALALQQLPVPARWTFTVAAGGQQPASADLTVTSLDESTARIALNAAAAGLQVTMPWVGWSTPADPADAAGDRAAPEPGEGTEPVGAAVVLDVVCASDPVEDAMYGPDLLIPFWRGVHDHRERIQVILTSQPEPGVGSTEIGISLSGAGPELVVLAGVVAAGLSEHPGELSALLRRGGTARGIPWTAVRVGRCLAAPSMLADSWPTRRPHSGPTVLDRLATSSPPHTAIFGGSGLGKTTLLEALVEARLACGRTTVVIDPHGDLAARAALSAAALGADVTCVDFGDRDQPPLWNLTQPPEGDSPREWGAALLGVIQAVWGDADPEWFGPVWRRTMGALLTPLLLDPAGPWPLTRITDLAAADNPTAPAARWRRGVLARIGDPAVAAGLSEARLMMDSDPHHHARTWLLGKLQPLLEHPTLHQIIDTPISSLDLRTVTAGRSLIVSTPASALGEEGSTIISMLILTRIWRAITRHGAPTGGLDLILDEAHRMPTALCQELLAEGRKFGLQLRLATQSPGLLPARLRSAVLTNSGTIATFTVGPDDAALLSTRYRDTHPAELLALPAHHVAISSTHAATITATGPTGRAPDHGATLRTQHRAELVHANPQLLQHLAHRLRAHIHHAGNPNPRRATQLQQPDASAIDAAQQALRRLLAKDPATARTGSPARAATEPGG